MASLIQAARVAGQRAQCVAKTMSGRADKQGASTYKGEKPPKLAPPRRTADRLADRRKGASSAARTLLPSHGDHELTQVPEVAVDVTQGRNKRRHGKASHRKPGTGKPTRHGTPATPAPPHHEPTPPQHPSPQTNTQPQPDPPSTRLTTPPLTALTAHHLAAAPLHPTAQPHFRTTHLENIW